MKIDEDPICAGLHGESCTNEHEPRSRWCTEHRRQYHREYARRRQQRKKEAIALARFVHEGNDVEARLLAAKILGEPPPEVEEPASGFQSVLDKYAAPE